MKVSRLLEDREEWQEMRFRDRARYSTSEAARRPANHPVCPLWYRAKERLEVTSR